LAIRKSLTGFLTGKLAVKPSNILIKLQTSHFVAFLTKWLISKTASTAAVQPCTMVHQPELNTAVVCATVLALVSGWFGTKMCAGVQVEELAIRVFLQASDMANPSGWPGNAPEGKVLNTATSGVTE
jgi:hypothetical protein